ncbi:histone-lysine N-methyltransferase SETDB1-B-like [Parambassis ranga]|uniref:Histone-lysine N-methyltransferase SETDB1-B-like n=1 Tax=Parambassis ranga TaxID=210632 RepID=A0A6P7HM10_9TELE|nr:histone-lysine N-methyltransferase SETDB1-B-like [Parambassis ranga]
MTQWESSILLKRAVVVLTRIPDSKISALRPPTPQQFYSEDDDSSSDSDMQWRPEEDSSDSDFSVSNKKQKKNNKIDTRQPVATTSNNSSSSEPNGCSTSSAHCSHETTNDLPKLTQLEVKVGMGVLARKEPMRWQKGKIIEIVTKEDGRIKYKVYFEDKARILLSGHHIASDATPTLEQLYVGARVVVQCRDNTLHYEPAVLAELPGRRNHLRFLVFIDDHTPAFVSLPLLHLVCRPVEDVLDDLSNHMHRCFMKKYLRDWPYPYLTQYKPGQTINVELDGVQQASEVQVVDCSLMQVCFQHNQHQEWIHRGSFRLEHMTRFLDTEEEKESEDD